jgi:uncharacterized protein DUF4406
MTKRLYISGPMTSYPGHNFDKFAEAAKLLKDAGYEVEDPAEKGIIDGWSWADYMRLDLELLLKCDGLAMLKDWHCSRGAALEVHVAQQLGMPVLPVEIWLAGSDD